MKKFISLFLSVLLLLTCLIGCASKEEENTDTNDTVSTNAETDDFPDIPKQDNGGKEIVILYPKWSLYDGDYYFTDGMYGSVVGDQAFTRLKSVEEHLGVKIVPTITTNDQWGGIIDVMTKIRISGMSQTDDYQMALTHCMNKITAVATEGYLTDFQEMPVINLDAEYWRKEQMNSVTIEGGMYFGSNSFIIPDPNVVLFNKNVVERFPAFKVADIYQAVRDKTWTLEKMKQYASAVDGEETYGVSMVTDWELIALMSSEGYRSVTQNSDGSYTVMDFNEKIDNICRDVNDFVGQDYYHGCESYEERDANMSSGKAMFTMVGLSSCINVVSNSNSDIGIVPYPSISEGVESQNLDWAGYMVIPTAVQDKELVGAVAELLCYYGEKIVYPAFYEKLLGARTADNLEDVEMLDLIFDNLVVDPGLALCDGADTHLGLLFYAIPRIIQRGGDVAVASYFEQYYTAAADKVNFNTK